MKNNNAAEEITRRIVISLNDRGIKQKMIAKYLDIDTSRVSRIFSGKAVFSLDHIKILIEKTGLPLANYVIEVMYGDPTVSMYSSQLTHRLDQMGRQIVNEDIDSPNHNDVEPPHVRAN